MSPVSKRHWWRVGCLLLLGLTVTRPLQGQADAAASLFADAERMAREGSYQEAAQRYELVARQYPESAEAPNAWLRLAQVRRETGNLDVALETAAEIQKRYPASRVAAESLWLTSEIAQDRASTLDDLRTIQNALSLLSATYGAADYPELPARSRATLASGHIRMLLGDLPLAAADFLSVLEDEPVGDWTSPAALGLARVWFREGEWLAALDVLQDVVNAGDETSDAPDARAARNLLSLAHRLIVRPSRGQTPWTTARRLPVPGVQLKDPVALDARGQSALVIVADGPLAVVMDPATRETRSFRTRDLRSVWWGAFDAYLVTKESVTVPAADRTRQFEVGRPGGDAERLGDLQAGASGLFGRVFLVDDDPSRVLAFADNGSYLSTPMGEREQPIDVAVDTRGRLYVLHGRVQGVMRFNAGGDREEQVVDGTWERPEALAVDALDNVYVLDRDRKAIDVFDPDGRQIASLGPSLPGGLVLEDPRDLGVDDTGRIYVADRSLDAVLVLE